MSVFSALICVAIAFVFGVVIGCGWTLWGLMDDFAKKISEVQSRND